MDCSFYCITSNKQFQNDIYNCYPIISFRLWDIRTVGVVRDIELPGPVFSIELSKDLSQLTVAHSNGVTFLDAKTLVR